MYCILVTGIPAAGKSTMASWIGRELNIPVISKDSIKEIMFDDVGFQSREEKVKLGVASMNIMYYMAEQFMKCKQTFILENNFENISRDGLLEILDKYSYTAITLTLTGDCEKIYRRFVERNESPERHRGHVVNDCYPEKEPRQPVKTIAFENLVNGIKKRGMDSFVANGPQIVVDTTDFMKVNYEKILQEIRTYIEEIIN